VSDAGEERTAGLGIRVWQAVRLSAGDPVPRAAFKVTLGNLFRLVAGLTRQVVLAAIFGAGLETDAYLTAYAVPFFLRAVLLSGLPSTLLPAFVRLEADGREDDAWELVGTFVWLTGVVLTVLAIAGALFSGDIIGLVAPRLSPAKARQATRMLVILMFSLPLMGLSNLTRAVENARNRFLRPALATGIGSVANTLTLLLLYRSVGAPAMAWGFLVSSVLQAGVTLVPVLAHGWRRLMPLSHPRVQEIVKLMAPIVLFGVLIHAVSLFERYYASGLPDGELTYLGYATKISDMIVALLGTGIATAMFPTMTRVHACRGKPGLVDTTEYGLRLTLAVALPALAITSAVALPLLNVLFERGAFGYADTLSVSRVLPVVMASGLVMAMVGGLLSQAFYVIKDTYSVSILAALASGLYIPLAGVLVGFRGFVGLAWARLLCSALPVVALTGLLTARLGLNLSRVLKKVVGYALASVVAALGAWMTNNSLGALPAALKVVGAVTAGGTIYVAALWPIDGEAARALLEMTGLRRVGTGARALFGSE